MTTTHQLIPARPALTAALSFTHVRGGLLQRECACGGTPGPSGECEACRKNREAGPLRRKATHPSSFTPRPSEVPPLAYEVLRSPGRPLDAATRSFMEPRFGHDFSQVRVHTDAKAAESARTVNALAYTVGREIVLQPEYYKPESTEGKRLLAHELTHVVQQGQGARRVQRAETRANNPIEVTPVGHPLLSRIDPPYPGAIGRCRAMGVPCPTPYFHHGTFCRLVTCSRAATANLPFAISPGVCVYQCSDGQICTCVLLGSATSAVCVITLCDSAASASSDTDYEDLTTRAVTLAQQQLGNAPAEEEGGRPGSEATLQAKLEIGESGNVYEREADAVAEKVMRMSDPGPPLQAKCGSGTAQGSGGGSVASRNERLSSPLDSANHVRSSASAAPGDSEPNRSSTMLRIQTLPPHDRLTLRRLSKSSLSRLVEEGQSGADETESEQAPEEEERNGTLQAKALPGYSSVSTPDLESGIQTLETGIVVQRVPVDGSTPGSRRRNPEGDPMGEDTPPFRQRGETLPYREATEFSKCLRIMGEDNAEYCRQEVLGEPPPPPVPPVVCDPNRDLTWADYQGTPGGGTFAAETHFHFDFATENNRQIIRAFFDSGTSWVRPRSGDPTNRAVNGCAPPVNACEQHFTNMPAGSTGTFHLGDPQGCAASISPNTTLNATSFGECESVLGTECDRVAPLESERLLRHEQLHFSIACVLARKGTDALFIALPSQAQSMITAVRTKANQLSNSNGQYDTQSAHGCNAAGQATWEARVQDKLPTVTIP